MGNLFPQAAVSGGRLRQVNWAVDLNTWKWKIFRLSVVERDRTMSPEVKRDKKRQWALPRCFILPVRGERGNTTTFKYLIQSLISPQPLMWRFGHHTWTSLWHHEERVYLRPVQHWTVCPSGAQWSWPFLLLRPFKAVNILQVSETFWPTDFGCFEAETSILCFFFSFRPWDCVTASTRVPLWLNLKSILFFSFWSCIMSSCLPECVHLVQHINTEPLCAEAIPTWICIRPHSDHIQKWSESHVTTYLQSAWRYVCPGPHWRCLTVC